jgi:hypothetical protein
MAAPTRAVQKLQKILANDGPSTHGLQPTMKRLNLTLQSLVKPRVPAEAGMKRGIRTEVRSRNAHEVRTALAASPRTSTAAVSDAATGVLKSCGRTRNRAEVPRFASSPSRS